MFTVNDRPVFRLGLTKERATYLARHQVKEYVQAGDPPRMMEVWDHLVELPGPDGEPVRLTIRVKGFGFQLPEPGTATVPVVVNRRRTKAHFDADDPSISLGARYEAGKRGRKAKAARDRAAFEVLQRGEDRSG
jgi:hypothetical protein